MCSSYSAWNFGRLEIMIAVNSAIGFLLFGDVKLNDEKCIDAFRDCQGQTSAAPGNDIQFEKIKLSFYFSVAICSFLRSGLSSFCCCLCLLLRSAHFFIPKNIGMRQSKFFKKSPSTCTHMRITSAHNAHTPKKITACVCA